MNALCIKKAYKVIGSIFNITYSNIELLALKLIELIENEDD